MNSILIYDKQYNRHHQLDTMKTYPSLFILTGAGISAESGIATFRDSHGTWNNYRIEDVATPQAFDRAPHLVNTFYNSRRHDAQQAQPNNAHLALEKIEKYWKGNFLLTTQNVDNLHERAGSEKILHMHGELNSALCTKCHHHMSWHQDIDEHSICQNCHQLGTMRPDIVWFGEMPYHMQQIEHALHHTDIFIAIGTSGNVYPAAGFVSLAKAAGASSYEVNLVCDNDVSSLFDQHIQGSATQTVPDLVEQLLHKYL